MQTLDERNTCTPPNSSQVRGNCDLVLNKDSRDQSKLISGLSVPDLKTSSNTPKWTNSATRRQNSRVSVVKQQKHISDQFKRDTQGMNFAQKLDYFRMSDEERTEIREKQIAEKEKEKEKEDKTAKQSTKDEKQQVSVFVLNMRGQPLMPTSLRKARLLLRNNKAKVVKRCPFTIQLKYQTGENKQPIKLGVDSGYKNVGLSATTEKRELFSAHAKLRTDIPEKLTEKKMYRRGRRNRNTRYRKARFDNRKSFKKRHGRLAPSIQHKLDSHIRLIDNTKQILPITSTTIEVATFDTQKMQNPEISSIEYQQGTLQGYEVREYLLEKWDRKCAYCGKTDVPFEIEHIIPPSRTGLGGSNRISNLTIACHECNQKKGNMTAAEFGRPEIHVLSQKSLKDAAFMNIVRWKLVNSIPECHHTYGYITKYNRIRLGLEKSHVNDAFVIAGGISQERCKPFEVKQIRRNNRSLQLNRKGFKPSIRKQRYKFSPGDLVIRRSSLQTTGWGEKIKKKDIVIYTVKGVFNYGKSIRLTNPIPGEKDINANIGDVKILKYGDGLLFQSLNNKREKNMHICGKMETTKEENIDHMIQREIEDAWN